MNSSVMVWALSSARLAKVATPPETVTLFEPSSGPPPSTDAVTSVLLSPVSRLPNGSSSSMTGSTESGWPAMAVDETCEDSTNWLAGAGLTTVCPVLAGVKLPLENSSVRVSALLSLSPVNAATPPVTASSVVPSSGPAPCSRARPSRSCCCRSVRDYRIDPLP